MQEVFEKIMERLENEVFSAELYGEKWNGQTVTNLLCLGNVRDVIEQAAAEYHKDNYFNMDEATLHKCPVCGGQARHRVNRRGSWACGCFECKVFKVDYNHGKAVQAWEDFCAEYNNGWIPVEERPPEESLNSVLGWDEYRGRCCFAQYWGGKWHLGNDDESVHIIAWQPRPGQYQQEGGSAE